MNSQKRVKTAAVVVAAGKGTRMNMDVNKQYIEISGIPILARTLAVFEDLESIEEIVLVVNEQDIIFCKENIIDAYGFEKVRTIVAGGRTRQESVFKGLREVDASCGIVAIHDGARPFIEGDTIEKSIAAAADCGAACVAVKVKDTIKAGDKEGFVVETLDRNVLWSIQTPQTFKLDLIREAHEKALRDGFTGTDDAVLAERLGIRLRLVPGTYENIKITTREDLIMAEGIVSYRQENR